MFSVGNNGSDNIVLDASGSVPVDTSACPDTKLTDFKLDIFNSANLTGSEGVDASVYVFDEKGVLVATITDTTSPTATDLQCGATFNAYMISTTGASGDPSVFDSVVGGASIVDGNLKFATTSAVLNLRANIEQHASLQVKAYDNILKANVYDTGDASATDYETDGVTFTSTTDNATASDETLGFDYELQFQAVESDTDGNDRGILVLLKMPATKWDLPSVYVDGTKLTKITLVDSEADAYTDYDYAFLIPADVVIKDGSEDMTLRVVNSLKAGITSVTADPELDLAIRGSHLATSGDKVITNVAVTDASTPAQIHNLFDITFDYT